MEDFVQTAENSYDTAHEMFLKYSNLHKVCHEYLCKYLSMAIQKLQPRCNEKQYNILSIGSGDGRMDQLIIKEVIDGLKKVENQQQIEMVNTAIEPHSYSLQQYRDWIQQETESVQTFSKQRVKFEFEEKPFDEYARIKHEKNRYDIIHAVHSFYWVENVPSSLKYCYENELKNKGFIVLIEGIECSLFQKMFSSTSKQKEYEHRSKPRFTDLAKKFNYEYESIKFNYTIDVSKVFQENSKEGNLLLDFLTFKPNFRQTTDKKLVDKVCQELRDMSTEDKEGKLWVTSEDDLTVIYKL
jgi:hypothetical protein